MIQRSFWHFAFHLSALIFCLLTPFVGKADEETASAEKKNIVINGKTFIARNEQDATFLAGLAPSSNRCASIARLEEGASPAHMKLEVCSISFVKCYKLRWINGGGYDAGQNYTPTGRADVAYLWDGETVWSVDPLRARVIHKFPSKFQVRALSPDKAWALVSSETGMSLMDVTTQEITCTFNGNESPRSAPGPDNLARFHLWVFSSNGKFIYPLSHPYGVKSYPYIDVEKKSVIEVSLFASQKEPDSLAGIVAQDGALIILAKGRTTHDGKSVSIDKLIRIPPDDPARMTITLLPAKAKIRKIFAARDGKILCLLDKSYHVPDKTFGGEITEHDYRLAWLNPETSKAISVSPKISNDRVFWAGFTPDGKEIYALNDFEGLSIYDTENLKLVANIKAGRRANAYSIGATFSDDRKLAFVAQPYAHSFDVVDTATHKSISIIPFRPKKFQFHSIAGVLPLGDECFVITTLLPYE